MKRFEGKVVVVTGGARNTGLEIVDSFLREGATVFFCGSSEASVAEGVKALESRGLAGFRGVKCDVSLRSDVETMMDVIEREAGRLDVVVSNAANFGLGQGTCLETTDDQFLSVLQVNVLGGFRLVQLVANRFFLRQEPNPATGQRGVVVFVGSNSSERVNRNRITYVASKGDGLHDEVVCRRSRAKGNPREHGCARVHLDKPMEVPLRRNQGAAQVACSKWTRSDRQGRC